MWIRVLLCLSVFGGRGVMLAGGVPIQGSGVGGEDVGEVSSPLHVAQCRATCIQETVPKEWNPSGQQQPECSQDSECLVCWRKCEELEMLVQWRSGNNNGNTQSSRQPVGGGEGDMDGESRIKATTTVTKSSKIVAAICSTSSCGSGCRVACSFYATSSASSPSPVAATRSSSVLILSPGKVTWPAASGEGPLVYVLIQQLPHLKWKQVTQTTQTWALLPKTLWDKLEFGVRSVRVLVVSSKGLVAIYHPVQTAGLEVTTTSSTTTTSTTITPQKTLGADGDDNDERAWSQMMKVDDNYPPPRESMDRSKVDNSDSADSEVEVVTMPEERGEPEDVWALRRLSLIHQKSLVIAELAWEDVKKAPEQEYLITWELDGGGLKGHLVTDSTTVSLSLWPDTLYHIQVELFEPNFEEGEQDESSSSSSSSFVGGSRSFPLSVDTSEASFPLLLVEKPSALLSRERLLTASTLVAVLVAAALTLGSLLLALSLRRLLRVPQHRGSFSLGKQLLDDTDDDGLVGDDKKTLRRLRGNQDEEKGHSQTYSHGPGVSVISSGGCDLLKGPTHLMPHYHLNKKKAPLHGPLSHHHHQQQQQQPQQGSWCKNGGNPPLPSEQVANWVHPNT
ncbi:uncharacterized protein LOC110859272 [Folsomia candida]|uniref:uncharacterized protein LOC110859272 n=1 Tax=Folsomia candida TaxID=158441 RepID=UPI000B8F6A66|nr:uncharacterized protein LOC110859272 [Folsomia candida]